MKIALCIIVEGDEKLADLKIAVGSAVDYIDDVYITTNGKNTKKVRDWCYANKYNHSHLDWNDDFSEQRNFNWAQVKSGTDFILWLDSDDQLVNGSLIPKLAKMMDTSKLDQLFLTYWYGCRFEGEKVYDNLVDIQFYHQRERLVRVNRIKWQGRIHETPVPLDNIDPKYTQIVHTIDDPNAVFPIAVLHRDATMENKERNLQRNARNMMMLEKQLADETETGDIDPRTVLYLMKIYAESDDETILIKCIRLGEQYLQTSGWDEERSTCYILLADCFGKLKEPDRCKKMLLGALEEYPHNKGIYLRLASVSYDLNRHKDMKHFMDVAKNIKVEHSTAGNRNTFDDEFRTEVLNLKYNFNVKKDIDEAYEASKLIYEMESFPENEDQVLLLEDMKSFNDACRNIDMFVKYLAKAKMYDKIVPVLDAFPETFKERPFYNRLKNTFSTPRKWGEKEVCYFANFGGPHIEPWQPDSLEKGLGGSETAVVMLAKLWTDAGYKVTVYGDPKVEGEYGGVNYLSFRRFNPKDRFNIFIQWRSGSLSEQITSNKFYVDLHDVWSEIEYLEKLDTIDKFFVKSKYHRDLAPHIPDEKFEIISNGL